MSWFGGKTDHQKQVAAVTRILVRLYEETTDPRGQGPKVLNFQLPDSRLRYLMFCLSTVHAVCARRMKNPDAVLNECAYNLVSNILTSDDAADAVGKGPLQPQKVMNDGSAYLGEFLDRWSTYIEITNGGNRHAATGLVCTMLRETESLAPAAEGDASRLWPLACWFEDWMKAIDSSFVQLAG
jgi:hypothetical protein